MIGLLTDVPLKALSTSSIAIFLLSQTVEFSCGEWKEKTCSRDEKVKCPDWRSYKKLTVRTRYLKAGIGIFSVHITVNVLISPSCVPGIHGPVLNALIKSRSMYSTIFRLQTGTWSCITTSQESFTSWPVSSPYRSVFFISYILSPPWFRFRCRWTEPESGPILPLWIFTHKPNSYIPPSPPI